MAYKHLPPSYADPAFGDLPSMREVENAEGLREHLDVDEAIDRDLDEINSGPPIPETTEPKEGEPAEVWDDTDEPSTDESSTEDKVERILAQL